MLSRTLCPVMVGRDEETARLERAFDAARTGAGRTVLITGDAGIGKTRLAAEFGRRAEGRGAEVLWGGCSDTDLQLPYLAVLEAIRGGLRRRTAAVGAEMDRLFGQDADPLERRLHLFEGVIGFLDQTASPHGVVLVLEDLHWSDAGTRDLLDYVVRALPGSRILLVATYRADEVYRSHPLQPLVRGWLQRDLATLVELAPLSVAETGGMVKAILGSDDRELATRLHRRSEGNPFVLEEFLRTGGPEAAEEGLPATVRDAILRRVEKLGRHQLQVLRAAAAMGQRVDDRILSEMFGGAVSDALEECAEQQLLTPHADGAYSWRHALTREAVYEATAPPRRRELHAQIADICDGRDGIDEMITCHHLAAAGRWQEAVPRCRQAAAAAISVGAFADAAQLQELCLPHVFEPSERAEILTEVADLLMQCGVPERGEAFARDALAIRLVAKDAIETAVTSRTLALCLWQQSRWTEALVLEDRALAELEQLGPSPFLVATLARRASWNVLIEGNMSTALALVGRARELATQHGFDPDLYLADEGQVLTLAGRVEEGLAIMDAGWRARLQATDRRGSRWREGKFMLHHAVALRNLLGRTTESLAALAEQPSSPTEQDASDVSLLVVEIEALWAHGELARARQLAERLDLRRVERNVIPWAQAVRAELLFSCGEVAAATSLARTALPPHWQPISQLRVAGLVRVLLLGGDLQGALELARRLDRLGGYGIDVRLPLVDAAVEAHVAAGASAEAERVAAAVVEAHPDHPLRLRVEARMVLAAGNPAEAAERLGQAAEGFVRAGHRQDEWTTRRLLARALLAQGCRAAAEAELKGLEQTIAATTGLETPPAALSRREREVALLVAQGLRNREIAERLFISERTVENHIHRVLDRTGLRSRAELAAQITRLSTPLSVAPE